MPEIQAEPGDWLDLFTSAFQLALHPTGAANTLEGNEAGILGPVMFWFFDSNPDKLAKINAEILSLIGHSDPNKFQIGQNTSHFVYGAMTSGHILAYVLRLARYTPKLASVESAVRILEQRYIREGSPAGTTSIKVAWTKYKHASPFVVGLLLASIRAEALIRKMPNIISTKHKLEHDVEIDKTQMKDYIKLITGENDLFKDYCREIIPYAAAYSEKYRLAGESFFASGQKARNKPLLDPNKTWSVPDGFELPKVELSLDRLTAEEIEAASVK